MKKILSLILCLIFVFSLTACGKKEKENTQSKPKKHSVDVAAFVEKGEIDTIEYKLGDSVKETDKALKNIKNEEGESNYYQKFSEDRKYIIASAGSVVCRYDVQNEDAGVTYIALSDKAFGFDIGTSVKDVKDAMKTLGHNATERQAKEGELFFLPRTASATILQYKFGKNTVMFIFVNSSLSYTVIYK